MLVPNRHANTPEYRYGFQGQEMDDELKGEGNSINYTFRMHDPRLGRFFAVDPLTKKYPHYTPYSFSGNKVTSHIELEGKEDLALNIVNPMAPNGIGEANLTITMAYTVVTQGLGQLHNSNLIRPADFADAYDSGDAILYSTNLPSPDNEANFLSRSGGLFRRSDQKLARLAHTATNPERRQRYMDKLASRGINSFYAINVNYNYSITVNPNTTLEGALTWMMGNAPGRGVFFNAEAGITRSPLILNAYGRALTSINTIGLRIGANASIGAAGLSTGILPVYEPGSDLNYNLVAGNPLHFGAGTRYSFNLSATGVAIHETGHNASHIHIHNTGVYEYEQSGLQSNTDPEPTTQNTIDIINDPDNRNTLDRN